MLKPNLAAVGAASNDYFANKAERYDLVENQLYWQLSDQMVRTLLKDLALRLPKRGAFLDAGGGTGRWSQYLLETYPEWSGTTIDLSPDMLAEADRKRTKGGFGDRWDIRQGDLHVQHTPTVGADLVICFHNVIGFVADPAKVMSNLFAMTAAGGYVVVMFPNRYHAAYFNVKRGVTQAAAEALRGWGRFAEDMPHIHMFTPDTASSLCADAGYQPEAVLGFPKFVYPGYEETRIQGDSSVVVNVLSDPMARSEIAKLELEYLYEPAAARGNNIVVIAKKPA